MIRGLWDTTTIVRQGVHRPYADVVHAVFDPGICCDTSKGEGDEGLESNGESSIDSYVSSRYLYYC